MPVSPCICCGCCVCADVSAGLATSYSVDLSGTWDVGGFTDGCPDLVSPFTLPKDVIDCEFSLFQTDHFLCVGGNRVSGIILALNCYWQLEVDFYDSDGTTGGFTAFYKQQTPDCADPTGVYVIDASVTDPASPIPATITVS